MLNKENKLKDELINKVHGGYAEKYEDGLKADGYSYVKDGNYIIYEYGNYPETFIKIDAIILDEDDVFDEVFGDICTNNPDMFMTMSGANVTYKVISRGKDGTRLYMKGDFNL